MEIIRECATAALVVFAPIIGALIIGGICWLARHWEEI